MILIVIRPSFMYRLLQYVRWSNIMCINWFPCVFYWGIMSKSYLKVSLKANINKLKSLKVAKWMKDEWRMNEEWWRMMKVERRMNEGWMKDEWRMNEEWMKNEWRMNEEWWGMMYECWRMVISSCLRGFGDWLTDKQTDICECRVTFATENSTNRE